MPNIKPISELRNYTEVLKQVDMSKRVYLTRNGHGMTAEQFLWAVIKSELLYPKKLVFQSEDIHYSCMQETISLGEKNQKDGAEIIKEREQRAEAKQRKKRKGRSDAFD